MNAVAVSTAGTVTPRQMQIVQGVARGLTNVELAAELGIAERTVKSHIDHLKYKLHVSRRRLLPTALLDAGIDPYPRGGGGDA
jgi:two-component system nitrate/nitrite response regulator NarL